MKEFHYWLHICDLVGEELDDCFVASNLAQPVHDLKEVGNIFRDRVCGGFHLFLDVVLEKPHYG